MNARTLARFVAAAKTHGLLIAECEGSNMGIGTRDELQELIDDGILPKETIFREARQEDF